MPLEKHLGGHKGRTHTDPGLLDFFWQQYDCRSMIDLGCGPGGQVELALEKGWQAHGVDGDYTLNRSFKCEIIDFAKQTLTVGQEYDLAWCVEFLEHVEEQYIPNYMPALMSARFCVITHALPGEPGHHHVNCQTNQYWIDKFAEYGLSYNQELTDAIRANSTMQRDFIRRRGLAFERNS